MATYETAHIDEIASKQWPHWIPIRHHFGIETFGMNADRRDAGEGVVPRRYRVSRAAGRRRFNHALARFPPLPSGPPEPPL